MDEWLDCGNKDATVYTNKRVLEIHRNEKLISDSVHTENSIIIPPCFIGEKVTLKNSIVGPHVSLGAGSVVENSVITNSILQTHTRIRHSVIDNSMVGHYAEYGNSPEQLSLSDYSTHQ